MLSSWLVGTSVQAQDAPNTKSERLISWPVTPAQAIKNELQSYLAANGEDPRTLDSLDWTSTLIHQQVVRTLKSVRSAAEILETPKDANKKLISIKNSYVRNVLTLDVAMQLVHLYLHDEAIVLLDQIDFNQLPQPSLGLIYKNICYHQLVETDKARLYAELLMANLDRLPLRYKSMTVSIYGHLMKQNEKPLTRVAKLMSDAGRRQHLERQTKKVLDQEQEIVKTLDKLINDLEKQKKQMKMAADSNSKPSSQEQSSGGESKPGIAGPKQNGDVESKEQGSDGNWGDLSQAEKAIAVKSLTRELPPHFQKLLNAYFQKLAEEKK